MTNLRYKTPRCHCGVQASFGHIQQRVPTHCSRCKQADMVNVIAKKCLCGSGQISNYNHVGVKGGKYVVLAKQTTWSTRKLKNAIVVKLSQSLASLEEAQLLVLNARQVIW